MKKVLLVTAAHSVFDKPFRRVFESLGWEVQTVDYWGNKILTPGKFLHKVVYRLPDRIKYSVLDLARWHIDFKVLANAKSYKPDLIFMLKAKNIHSPTLIKLKSIAKTINYYPETFNHWNSIRRIASHCDYFFNCDPEVVKRLEKAGHKNVYYLPFSTDIDQDAIFPDFSQKKYAISFVGSFDPMLYAHRETILGQIKDLGLNVWGNKAWLDTSLKNYYRSRPNDEEMFKIYRESKIVVNIDLMNVEGAGVNLRPFEITSCGAMLLNHDERKEIFNLFRNEKEFVSFGGPEDIRQKVKYYLGHEEELKAIARAGFEKTKNSHTYTKRVEEIIKIANLEKT